MSTFHRTGVAVLTAVGVLCGAVSVDAASAATTCRASAARTITPSLTSEPTVANPAATPCTTQSQEAAGAQPVGDATVTNPKASTRAGAGVLAATASVDGANLSGALLPVSVGHVDVTQVVSCQNGKSAASGTSNVDGLTVAGTPVSVIGGQSMDQTIAGVRIRTNQLSGDTRQALVVDIGDTEYVLGEARASGDACESLVDGISGHGGGGGDLSQVCPNGASYDVASNHCVITTAGVEKTIVVGRPYSGPSGGTLISLAEARQMVKDGKLRDSRCLHGKGPNYVVLASKKSDKVTGSNRSDRMLGIGGNDRMDGGRGNDCVDGGTGSDTVSGGQGADTVIGGSGKDHLNGGQGTDKEIGGTGNDTINTGYGADRVDAGPGNDAINAATQGPAARINGGPGRDIVRINRNERGHVVRGERIYVLR
jgi:Ca2+-binding RTX toxin-like protein